MKHYRVFGGRLRSDLAFPDLAEAADDGRAPDWTLSVSDGPPPAPAGDVLGEDRVNARVRVRLHRDDGGARLAYDDTGDFTVSADGRDITWWPGPDAEADPARLDVLGRVLPLALHLRGRLVLHASAVSTPAGAVGFLGPKGSGKTTLALALSRQGAPVLTDDSLVVDVAGDVAVAWPGVPNLRLRRDAAERAGLGPGERESADGRTLVRPPADVPAGPLPLAALYLLDPVSPDADADVDAVRRVELDAPPALALLGQTKLGALLGGGEAVALLRRAVSVAEAVPVRRLRVRRDPERIDEVAKLVLESVPTPTRAGAPS